MQCAYCGYERGATVTAACPHCGAPASKSQEPGIETYLAFDPGGGGYRRRVVRFSDAMDEMKANLSAAAQSAFSPPMP